MKQKLPRGVLVFGVLFIVSSLMHIQALIFNFHWYFDIYSYWPKWLILIRYLFSWFQRILGLVTAIGILRLKNIFRRIAIAIGVFTILTVYWKHPYAAFKNHAETLDRIFANTGFNELISRAAEIGLHIKSFAELALAAVIGHAILDIIFCGSLIYYLTRPAVKEKFE